MKMDRTPRCQYSACQPLPAIALPRKILFISENKSIRVCRKHKSKVAQLNAQAVGRCEWDLVSGDPPCIKRPITMALPAGQPLSAGEIAVCRVHNSIINTQYASMRKGS